MKRHLQQNSKSALGHVFLLLVLMQSFSARAQQDSLQVFSLSDFLQQVMLHHPVAKQAALLPEQARHEIRVARGLFDPSVNSKYSSKEFKGTDYYTYQNHVLEVPTWLGADLRAGYERNTGAYINPDKVVPSNGLTYVGISIPLGQGLLIDERRATLRQAKLLAGLAEAERVSALNKLLLQVTKDYWDWAFFYHKNRLLDQGLQLAQFRLSAVRQRALAGDMAAIDTVEALMEVQNRQVLLRLSQVEFENSRLILSNHLWREKEEPANVSPQAIPFMGGATPQSMAPEQLRNLLAEASVNHPDLRKLHLKQQHLHIDRKLYLNKLLPKLNAEYNVLQTGPGINEEGFTQGYFRNNYKMGFSFSYPLFLRNERGNLQLANIKLQNLALDQQQTQREIMNGILAGYNEMVALQDQIAQQEQLVENARTLRNGEATRFMNGESTLFLINSREAGLINQEVKYFEMLAKYAKSRTALQWSAGTIVP